MKQIRYVIEAILLRILLLFFKCLSPETASNIGGWIGRTIGPRLAKNRIVNKHISNALPKTTETEKERIIIGMWDNLGRIIAEYAHLKRLAQDYTEIENLNENYTLDENGGAAIFIGGHIGNFEIPTMAAYLQTGLPLTLTYREPNNPIVAKHLDQTRTLNGEINALAKSQESGKKIIQTLKNNTPLGILIDQKYNQGIEAPFFDLAAMTNPAFVQLCQKYKCPAIPIRCKRIKGCQFKLIIYPEIPMFNKDQSPRPAEDVIKDAHALLEQWITEQPEQWLWLHRRWKNI